MHTQRLRWPHPRKFFFFSSRRRHTRLQGDWSSDVCSSDLRTSNPPYCTNSFHKYGSETSESKIKQQFAVVLKSDESVNRQSEPESAGPPGRRGWPRGRKNWTPRPRTTPVLRSTSYPGAAR